MSKGSSRAAPPRGFSDRAGLGPVTVAAEPDKAILSGSGPGQPLVEIECELIEERVKALLVRDKANRTAWLPRSELKIERGVGVALRLTMPNWLAVEKGLVAVAGAGQGRLF